MTNPVITLRDVSLSLPDSRQLFSGLNHTFDHNPTGLVGRNGVGKTLLARILAGQLSPSQGHRKSSGSVHYLGQQITPCARATVADLAGLGSALQALSRIESGGCDPQDFDLISDRWDLKARFRLQLDQLGLSAVPLSASANALSGGQRMRVALAGALLSDADFLILDEPSNHLDRDGRETLKTQLSQWQRGLIVISHDRELLWMAIGQCEARQESLRKMGTVTDQVLALLHQAEGKADLDTIADRLHMSPRTLIRKLKLEDTRFQQLRDQTLSRRATQLLSLPHYTVAAVAEDLGYTDVASFRRAFQRWFGTSPGKFRQE